MAWTAPRTWVAGEVPTAANFNTHIRDNLRAIGDPWTAFVPVLTGWTLGNGTLSGTHITAGKLVHARIKLTTGSTTAYSGGPVFSLPTATIASVDIRDPLGTATLLDTSAGGSTGWRHYFAFAQSATTVALASADGVGLTPTTPWTWATGDRISIILTYEAA